MKRHFHFGLGALGVVALGLTWSTLAGAKDIAVAGNNTPYNQADVQKLAGTAVKMGVKEPVSLHLAGGNLTVSGTSQTTCVIKVGGGNAPQIAGISCR